jgi:DNA-binding NtrC family response regulator
VAGSLDGQLHADTTDEDPRCRPRLVASGTGPLLTLVIDAEHPSQGSLRADLSGTSELLMGRGREHTLVRSGAGALLTMPDRWVSIRHARIELSRATAEIVDMESKNGTFVNGARVHRAMLRDGDVLETGHCFFVFRAPMVLERDESMDSYSLKPPLHSLCPQLEAEFIRLRRIADSSVPLLLLGETGTGKEVAAAEVHRISGRRGNFVAVNCAALPASLMESELFGYRRGAFSGAFEDRPGLLRSADGGTLFLDEIGDLPLGAQAAILRPLQESEVLSVGSTRPVKIDLRVIAATHRDIDALVSRQEFRADLLGRLSGFRMHLPPLRERREDLGLLLGALLQRHAGSSAASIRLEPDAARALMLYDWPLNVRELERCLSSALALTGGAPVGARHLHAPVRAALERRPAAVSIDPKVQHDPRREELVALLREHRGNVTRVAANVGKARTQVQRWLKRYQIDPRQFRR